jgi:hypothetical protein
MTHRGNAMIHTKIFCMAKKLQNYRNVPPPNTTAIGRLPSNAAPIYADPAAAGNACEAPAMSRFVTATQEALDKYVERSLERQRHIPSFQEL